MKKYCSSFVTISSVLDEDNHSIYYVNCRLSRFNNVDEVISNKRKLFPYCNNISKWCYQYEYSEYKQIRLIISFGCNFNCLFCCYKGNYNHFIADKNILEKVFKEDLNKIEKIDYITNCSNDYFADKLFKQYFDEFVESRKVGKYIQTNLYDFKREDLKKQYLKTIQVSIYGSNNEEYFNSVGVKDSYEKVMENLRDLVDYIKNTKILLFLRIMFNDFTYKNAFNNFIKLTKIISPLKNIQIEFYTAYKDWNCNNFLKTFNKKHFLNNVNKIKNIFPNYTFTTMIK